MAANVRQKVVKLPNNAQLVTTLNTYMKYLLSISLLLFLTVNVSGQKITPVKDDKKYHFGAGAYFGLWGTGAGKSLELSDESAALFGIGAAFTAGIGKELWDVSMKGQFDINDISATVFGGVVSSGITYACLKIFKKKPVVYAIIDKQGVQVGFKKYF